MTFMSEKQSSPKTCPRCGKTFECLHAPGCWCFDYSISPENLEKLKLEYNNCLCPDCLPAYGKKKDKEAATPTD
jgi:hypothetical protein